MSEMWFYTIDGTPVYFQKGKCIYNARGVYKFLAEKEWWQDVKSGNPIYSIKDGWVYAQDGEPAFFTIDHDAARRPPERRP